MSKKITYSHAESPQCFAARDAPQERPRGDPSFAAGLFAGGVLRGGLAPGGAPGTCGGVAGGAGAAGGVTRWNLTIHRKTMGKPYRKTIGKLWFHGIMNGIYRLGNQQLDMISYRI